MNKFKLIMSKAQSIEFKEAYENLESKYERAHRESKPQIEFKGEKFGVNTKKVYEST